jgi:hypothetical protein
MKLLGTAGLFGALIAGASVTTYGATLFTPPLPGGGAGVFCQALNATATPRDVTITIFDANAQTVNTATCANLDAFHACTLAVPGAGASPHSCRIDTEGGKATVRASIVRGDSTGFPAVALPAE